MSPPHDRILYASDLRRVLGICNRTIVRWVKRRILPPNHGVSCKMRWWYLGELARCPVGPMILGNLAVEDYTRALAEATERFQEPKDRAPVPPCDPDRGRGAVLQMHGQGASLR